MPSKPDADERQRDFFGLPAVEPKPRARAPAPTPPPALATPPAKPRVVPGAKAAAPRPARPPAPMPVPTPMPMPEPPPEPPDLHDLIAHLSPAELRNLTATLTDAALAQLTLATIRQLKRRLAREARYGNKAHGSPLDRAAQQLVAELGGQGEEDDL